MSQLLKICVQNYRNHEFLEIFFTKGINIIYGKNGIGKTNLLEAISMVTSSKSIRSVKYANILPSASVVSQGDEKISENLVPFWSIYSEILGEGNREYKIGISYHRNGKKELKMDGKFYANIAKFPYSVRIVWFTPQISNIFLESNSHRRKFFDRIVYMFYNSHANYVREYEKLSLDRRKILKEENYSHSSWLNIIEEKMSYFAIRITCYRYLALCKLQKAIDDLSQFFSQGQLNIECAIHELLKENDIYCDIDVIYEEIYNSMSNVVTESLNVEIGRSSGNLQARLEARLFEYFENNKKIEGIALQIAKKYFMNRRNDLYSNHYGVNKASFTFLDVHKKQFVEYCSTGEQKNLLLTLLLGQCNALRRDGIHAILLLDDIFEHLDFHRRDSLIREIGALPNQAILSSIVPFYHDHMDCHNINFL